MIDPPGCFAAGTPILTPDGHRSIEELREGDFVLSRPQDNPEGNVVPRRVMTLFQRYVAVIELRVGGRSIITTAEHPFWVEGRGWVLSHLLAEGDPILGQDDRFTAIQSVREAGTTAVYNVEIDEYHTYFVGKAQWGFSLWAHNNDDCLKIGLPQHPNHVSGLPYRYKDAPFRRFAKRADEEFRRLGIDDASLFMQGSAASGVKHKAQQVLDARRGIKPSDYDVAIISPKLMQKAKDLNIDVLSGPLTPAQIAQLGLTEAPEALSKASKGGIPVNFKLYKNVDDIYNYGKTIPFGPFME